MTALSRVDIASMVPAFLVAYSLAVLSIPAQSFIRFRQPLRTTFVAHRTTVRYLVTRYDVLPFASFGNDVPVDGIDVAECRILLKSYGSA